MKIIRLAKITSEDCVNWIVQNVAPDTNPSEWKRKSKKMIGNYIVRFFENTRTRMTTQVYEQNGAITRPPPSTAPDNASPSSPLSQSVPTRKQPDQKKIYYVIARTTNTSLTGAELETSSVILYVTDAKEFDEDGCQSDYTPPASFKELKKLGYDGSEMMEAVIEITPLTSKTYDLNNIAEWAGEISNTLAVDIEDLKAKLASSSVFEFSQRFSDFISGFAGDLDAIIVPM